MADAWWSGEWKWTETPEFAQDCEELDDDPGEADRLRGVIGDSILADPIAGSNDDLYRETDPEYNPNVRYFRTFEAPGLDHLRPRLVIFEVGPEPQGDAPRELTGLALWADYDAYV